jgi:hypothetical protein
MNRTEQNRTEQNSRSNNIRFPCFLLLATSPSLAPSLAPALALALALALAYNHNDNNGAATKNSSKYQTQQQNNIPDNCHPSIRFNHLHYLCTKQNRRFSFPQTTTISNILFQSISIKYSIDTFQNMEGKDTVGCTTTRLLYRECHWIISKLHSFTIK